MNNNAPIVSNLTHHSQQFGTTHIAVAPQILSNSKLENQ